SDTCSRAMPDSIHLAELVAARACHDLGGAVGRLTGAVELAATGAGTLAEAVAAARVLGRRLDAIRTAFGPGSVRLDPAMLRALLEGIPGQERVRLDLAALPARTSFGPGLGRGVLLALLLLAPEALPRGGAVVLAPLEPHALVVRLQGLRAAWPIGFAAWKALASPGTLLGAWIALLAPRLGVQLSWLLPTASARGAGPAPLLLRAAPGD
ncbi:MAG: hypothetical protein KGI51_14400, partial [Rhodospirillales bacterium]|nr:hypothetical protein [Rhodospirillales bacterium]